MQNKLWRLAAGVIVVMGLAGCSTVSKMTDSVSQTVSKTWSGMTGKSKPVLETVPAAAPVALPSGLKASQESGPWMGLYSMEGDTGKFQECKTGQIIPVQAAGDSALLEQAYLNTRSNTDVVMLAQLTGCVLEQPAADPLLARQGRKILALRVERFVSLSSKAQCP
jgi:hypothetical protein